jgi:hypothetical protein
MKDWAIERVLAEDRLGSFAPSSPPKTVRELLEQLARNGRGESAHRRKL